MTTATMHDETLTFSRLDTKEAVSVTFNRDFVVGAFRGNQGEEGRRHTAIGGTYLIRRQASRIALQDR